MAGDLVDPRRQEPTTELPEREMLEGWLEYHRTTLLLKCEGLDDADRKRRPVPSSLLSLHGLVRHMAEVERSWFQRTFGSDPEVPYLFCTPEDFDRDFSAVEEADWEADLQTWQQECESSRRAAAGHDLEETGTRSTHPFSLRWIYLHMIEEYARHNGHADLIREMIDGSVGC
jgi:uncharacterized damage-inducible protein DinB